MAEIHSKTALAGLTTLPCANDEPLSPGGWRRDRGSSVWRQPDYILSLPQSWRLVRVRFRADGNVLDQFDQLVNPQCEIPAIVSTVHGITNQMATGQPTITEVLPKLIEFFADSSRVFLAHATSAWRIIATICPAPRRFFNARILSGR